MLVAQRIDLKPRRRRDKMQHIQRLYRLQLNALHGATRRVLIQCSYRVCCHALNVSHFNRMIMDNQNSYMIATAQSKYTKAIYSHIYGVSLFRLTRNLCDRLSTYSDLYDLTLAAHSLLGGNIIKSRGWPLIRRESWSNNEQLRYLFVQFSIGFGQMHFQPPTKSVVAHSNVNS